MLHPTKAGMHEDLFGVIWRMRHLSEWHTFNADIRETYPRITATVQVRYANGGTSEGDFLKLLSHVRVLHEPPITDWRYIKDDRIK